MATQPAKLILPLSNEGNDQIIELPILHGSMGPDVIDVSALYAKTGYYTYDLGFFSTSSCSSKICYVDGDKGILLYRGYSINDLVEKCDFMEVTYLLLKGELPNQHQKDTFVSQINFHTL